MRATGRLATALVPPEDNGCNQTKRAKRRCHDLGGLMASGELCRIVSPPQTASKRHSSALTRS